VNSRDDFSPKVKRAVASRAGWLCSLRGCGKHTIGPSEEGDDKVASIGEAAHICAASPGGRRYDALMTPDERSGINNAIWLCSDHAKLIDRDEVTYTAEWLHTSKHEHEAARGRAILTGSGVDLAGLLAIGPMSFAQASLRKSAQQAGRCAFVISLLATFIRSARLSTASGSARSGTDMCSATNLATVAF
jgi:hypothetical protein